MATNNAVNLKSSGIVSYDGAGTFTALANPLTVTNGGTGVGSNTAFAVLCGGTSSTGAIQSIAGLGTSGQFLVSNGAGALPTFQTVSSGTAHYISTFVTKTGSPLGSTTYYLTNGGSLSSFTNLASMASAVIVPVTGTISTVYGACTVQGTLASTQNSTLTIYKNGVSQAAITSTLKMNTADNAFSNTGLSIAVTAGDYIHVQLITGAFTTTPTTVAISLSFMYT